MKESAHSAVGAGVLHGPHNIVAVAHIAGNRLPLPADSFNQGFGFGTQVVWTIS